MTVVRRRFTLEDQAADRYPTIEFEAGARVVQVRLSYDPGRAPDPLVPRPGRPERAAAVIDLGLEDAERWRGWSGGARDRVVVTPDAATPGYLPGPFPDGRGRVVLGLHRIPPEGVEVVVEITPAAGVPEPEPPDPPAPDVPRGSARRLPAPPGLTWFAGDLHSHSTHSDGALSLGGLAAAASGRGLDFLAVTEHNTTSHFAHLPGVGRRYGLALIPGQEVTTARGHANAFGELGFVDFRRHPDAWVAEVAAGGGLLSINHPLQDDCAWQWDLAAPPPLLEFWHISWFLDLTATAPWAWWEQWRRRADADPTVIGGSDFHAPGEGYPPGTPTTWVCAADRTPDAILDAVARGRTAISRFPTPGDPVAIRHDGEVVVVEGDGAVLVSLEGRRTLVRGDRWSIPAPDGLVRVESADGSLLAVC